MPGLSYKEKSLYGMLAANLIVYVPYFVVALRGDATFSGLLGTIIAVTFVSIILQAIIAATSRSRITDERDQLIELRGYRAAYITLASGVVLIFGILWIHAPADMNHPHFGTLHIINVLFAALVLAEVVKIITQLVSYRKAL